MSEREQEQPSNPDGFERITPAQIRPGAPAADKPTRTPAKSLPAAWVGIALVLFLMLGASVFFWLPQGSSPATAVQQATPDPVAPTSPADEVAPPADAETLLSQREQAQTRARELSEKRDSLQAQNVQRWAANIFAKNTKLSDTAAAQFEQRDYTGAIENTTQGIAQADKLLAQADKVLADALARGEAAFADEDRPAAVEAYELALAVASENANAQKGLARAQSLDAVLEKMRAGKTQEQNNELGPARESYQAALNLDGEYQPARQALARVQSQITGKAFSQHMSRGLAALDRGDFAAAQSAFESARKLAPNDSSARDGLTQANAGLQQQAIARHQKSAQAAAAQENWQQALDEYQAALKLDPALSFAQSGEKRATERLQLDQKLQYHLDNQKRLSDKTAQAGAEAQLAQARSLVDAGADAGPRLENQIKQLSDLLAAMRRPVPVQLVSDKRTQVLVYHVGDLGSFERKRLELTPGEYTVVGRCPGYRDVRRTIEVKADQALVGPVSIRCEEKI